jgi:hypothetical protein
MASKKVLRSQSEIASAVATPAIQPLLLDIKAAAAVLGISVFAVRNLCWNPPTKRVLKPVRQGLKFLFSPAALNEFAAKLVSGEIQFPATPVKARRRAGRAA